MQNPCNRTAGAIRNLGAFLEEDVSVTSWLQVTGGVRLDHFIWDLDDLDPETTFVANRGNAGALALAPRVTGGGGATLSRGQSFAALRARGIGDRPANDEDTLTGDVHFTPGAPLTALAMVGATF